MGAVYFAAFASYYLQYPGLLGEDGLLPSRPHWESIRSERLRQVRDSKPLELDLGVALGWWSEGLVPYIFKGARPELVALPRLQLAAPREYPTLRAFLEHPNLLWFLTHGTVGLHVDQALEGIALFGSILAILAMLGAHHIGVFAVLYVSYLSLYFMGQRWLSFQWDIFLLETGAMLLFYCPVFSVRAVRAMPPAAWLLRVLIVKFMYMNGVVKITAMCPTWHHLTALEYHFASTCIPTSEAWIHHQLPPFVLRMGVAFMFVVELAAPWMLLVPICMVRRVGVVLQAALQVGIIITGNYNWFNVHTIALLLPAWEDDRYYDTETSGLMLHRILCWVPQLWGRIWSTWFGAIVAFLGSLGFLAWSFMMMFEVHLVDGGGLLQASDVCESLYPPSCAILSFLRRAITSDYLMVKSIFTAQDVNQLSAAVLSPRVLGCFFAFVGASSARYTFAPLACCKKGRLICAAAFASSIGRLLKVLLLLPFLALCILECESIHRDTRSALPFAAAVKPLQDATAVWHVSNSYGLFRRMTGVGQAKKKSTGWGGLPPSVPAVPVVVVEGSDDFENWHEIVFRYTPGSPTRQPRRTAPHQPRLDWQMWFAALGSYNHNPWFVHLMYKILDGAGPEVEALLDVDEYRWRGKDGPRFVRSWLYHYDFTRLDTAWARTIPGARVINVTNNRSREEWWVRKQVRAYMEPADRESLKQIAERQGWPVGQKRRKELLAKAGRCKHARKAGMAPGLLCDTIVASRRLAHPWTQ